MRHAFSCALLLAALLTGSSLFAAETATPPAPGGSSAPLPKLNLKSLDGKKTDPRLCPRCGKPYEECIKIGECVKAADIPVRPFPCPVCGLMVNVPLRDMRTEDIDADLCPHPKGLIRFYSPVIMCPGCGFSAYREDFRKSQAAETAQWVKQTLQPVLHQELNALMGLKLNLPPEKLTEYFNQQESLPDIIRCTNAAAYYERTKAPDHVQATMAWQLAWAHRRAISSPMNGPHVMDTVREVNALMEKGGAGDLDLEERINMLSDMSRQKARYPILQQQMMLIMLAGYYNRAGYNRWTKVCLEDVIATATKKPDQLEKDPWLEGVEGTLEQRVDVAKQRRAAYTNAALDRMRSLLEENRFLDASLSFIVRGLQNNAFPPEETASYIYLVGEFERRRENFSRALLWLTAAQTLAGEKFRLENFAPQQIERMKTYVAALKMKPEPNALDKTDRALLGALVKRVKESAAPVPAPAQPAK